MEEIFQNNLREEQPVGVLHAVGKKFWLLSPEPLPNESWEGENCYRFLVTPKEPIEVGKDVPVYAHARHIVTTNFTIEYSTHIPAIWRKKLLHFDVSEE